EPVENDRVVQSTGGDPRSVQRLRAREAADGGRKVRGIDLAHDFPCRERGVLLPADPRLILDGETLRVLERQLLDRLLDRLLRGVFGPPPSPSQEPHPHPRSNPTPPPPL